MERIADLIARVEQGIDENLVPVRDEQMLNIEIARQLAGYEMRQVARYTGDLPPYGLWKTSGKFPIQVMNVFCVSEDEAWRCALGITPDHENRILRHIPEYTKNYDACLVVAVQNALEYKWSFSVLFKPSNPRFAWQAIWQTTVQTSRGYGQRTCISVNPQLALICSLALMLEDAEVLA